MAMYAFVALGLPDGMIGTAWPAVRNGFGVPLDGLGVVLLGRYGRGGLQFFGVGPSGRPPWHTPDRHAGGVGRLPRCLRGHRVPRFLGFRRGGCRP